ncbi:MAG TPA: UbiA family prenyltransferase [Puia sp.]|nr:UbiA family prenyltransferase [Puia sp.]
MLRKIVDFIVFSSLYVAICAVLMIWQTSRLLLGAPSPFHLLGFVFFATMCSYNFHWYLTPRSANPSRRVHWTHRHRTLHLILYATGAIGAIFFYLYLKRFTLAIGFAALLTFLYSAPKLPQRIFRRLRSVAIGKTLFLAAVWTYVTAVLPVIVSASSWNPSFYWYIASRFFLIYGVCLVFDFRDREDDRTAGIVSIVTLVNERGIDRLFIISMILFFFTSIALSWYHYAAFYLILLLIPGAILAALYPETKRNYSDYLYYVALDGIVMLSGLLMLIFRI